MPETPREEIMRKLNDLERDIGEVSSHLEAHLNERYHDQTTAYWTGRLAEGARMLKQVHGFLQAVGEQYG